MDTSGGSAFPKHPNASVFDNRGMTLRDYFASHAPGDLCKNPHEYIEEGEELIGRPYPKSIAEQGEWAMEIEAKLRYLYADAMLREREKSE